MLAVLQLPLTPLPGNTTKVLLYFFFFLTIKKETQTRFCSYFSLCDTVVTTSTGKMTYSALAVIKTHHLGVPVQGNVGGR